MVREADSGGYGTTLLPPQLSVDGAVKESSRSSFFFLWLLTMPALVWTGNCMGAIRISLNFSASIDWNRLGAMDS